MEKKSQNERVVRMETRQEGRFKCHWGREDGVRRIE